MPLQNRVNPFGELICTPARGTFMGNRGILVDETGTIRKKWAHKAWITCLLSYKGNRQPLNQPGTYTPLFFLDEATALAAGHRPCAYCRRADFNRFVDCWHRGNGTSVHVSAKEIDTRLHDDRVTRDKRQVTYHALLDGLPDGVFVELEDAPATAWLIWWDELSRWQPDGYGERRRKPVGQTVRVLTPRSTVNAIAAGYRPHVHLHH